MVLQQASFNDRDNFGHFLNERGLLGKAVEVGTDRGIFARKFLETWKGSCLYCVDNYASHYDPADTTSQGDREEDYTAAIENLQEFTNRRFLCKLSSLETAKVVDDETIDFVYVDACHQYESVKQDLELWWPKLRSGGILAGHDIVCPGAEHGGWGLTVQPAVFKFADMYSPTVYLVVESNECRPWSFYLEKP